VAENELVRIEVGLDGGQILSALVTPASADALDRALHLPTAGPVELEAQDGVIVLFLPRVVYVKRFAREGRLGFGA